MLIRHTFLKNSKRYIDEIFTRFSKVLLHGLIWGLKNNPHILALGAILCPLTNKLEHFYLTNSM